MSASIFFKDFIEYSVTNMYCINIHTTFTFHLLTQDTPEKKLYSEKAILIEFLGLKAYNNYYYKTFLSGFL